MKTNILVALCVAFLFPSLAAAQSTMSQDSENSWTARPGFEIIASVAMAHPFRFGDRGFGNHLNFGMGAEVSVWRGLRIGGEMNRTFGLSPSPVECGAIFAGPDQPLPCIGTARSGLGSATAGSITAAYFFGEGRVQPYLLGGVSIMNAKQHTSISIVHKDYVEFRENAWSSTGIGPTFGAGLRASINRYLSIRPEVRFSDGTSLSSLNLSQWRISVGAAYGW
jgi:opacity protein-like surface antigen